MQANEKFLNQKYYSIFDFEITCQSQMEQAERERENESFI